MRITASELATWKDPDGRIRLGTEGGVGLLVVDLPTDQAGLTALLRTTEVLMRAIHHAYQRHGLNETGRGALAAVNRALGSIMARELGLVGQEPDPVGSTSET